MISSWILVRKVRSQALICVFRFYYFLLYYVFYRTLFARLRSPDQAAYITLLSSILVVAWYPISMSKTCWRIFRRTVGAESEWSEYAANRGTELYIRNLSENVTSPYIPFRPDSPRSLELTVPTDSDRVPWLGHYTSSWTEHPDLSLFRFR